MVFLSGLGREENIVDVVLGSKVNRLGLIRGGEEGIKVGIFRPVSLYPYPYDRIREVVQDKKAVLVVEMSGGQMLEDVQLAVQDRVPISFYGRMGGMVPYPDEILEEIREIHKDV